MKLMPDDYKFSPEDIEAFFQLKSDLICIADLESAKFIKINAAFSNILGYSEDELLEKPFLEFIHEDDRQKTTQIMETELKAGKELISFTNRYRCKDGSYKWLDWHSYPISKDNKVYAIAHDITEKRKLKDDLKASEEKYRTYVDNSPIGIFIANSEGKYIEVNPQACKVTGYSEKELLEMTVLDIVSKDYVEKTLEGFKKLSTEGKNSTGCEDAKKRRGNCVVDCLWSEIE
jgi:PAS domain S-box-containing protein